MNEHDVLVTWPWWKPLLPADKHVFEKMVGQLCSAVYKPSIFAVNGACIPWPVDAGLIEHNLLKRVRLPHTFKPYGWLAFHRHPFRELLIGWTSSRVSARDGYHLFVASEHSLNPWREQCSIIQQLLEETYVDFESGIGQRQLELDA